MSTIKGLLYVKHGRVGSRSEGPDYHLQTVKADYLLQYKKRVPWEPDYCLEFYCRRMVEVRGKIIDKMPINVEGIHEICVGRIPPE